MQKRKDFIWKMGGQQGEGIESCGEIMATILAKETIILENGGAGPAVGTLVRQILDHVLLGDNNTVYQGRQRQRAGPHTCLYHSRVPL